MVNELIALNMLNTWQVVKMRGGRVGKSVRLAKMTFGLQTVPLELRKVGYGDCTHCFFLTHFLSENSVSMSETPHQWSFSSSWSITTPPRRWGWRCRRYAAHRHVERDGEWRAWWCFGCCCRRQCKAPAYIPCESALLRPCQDPCLLTQTGGFAARTCWPILARRE